MGWKNEWQPDRVFEATAGEMRDGLELLRDDGKPLKRSVPVVVIERRYYKQICRAWLAEKEKQANE